jgi:hypothetical protein
MAHRKWGADLDPEDYGSMGISQTISNEKKKKKIAQEANMAQKEGEKSKPNTFLDTKNYPLIGKHFNKKVQELRKEMLLHRGAAKETLGKSLTRFEKAGPLSKLNKLGERVKIAHEKALGVHNFVNSQGETSQFQIGKNRKGMATTRYVENPLTNESHELSDRPGAYHNDILQNLGDTGTPNILNENKSPAYHSGGRKTRRRRHKKKATRKAKRHHKSKRGRKAKKSKSKRRTRRR